MSIIVNGIIPYFKEHNPNQPGMWDYTKAKCTHCEEAIGSGHGIQWNWGADEVVLHPECALEISNRWLVELGVLQAATLKARADGEDVKYWGVDAFFEKQ